MGVVGGGLGGGGGGGAESPGNAGGAVVVTELPVTGPPAAAMPAPVHVSALAAPPATGPAQAVPSASAVATKSPPLAAESRPVQGKDGFQVERLARNSACGTDASARLIDSGAGYEVYEIECTDVSL